MPRATTLIIAAIALFKGVSSITAAPCSVTSPPCDGIDHNPLPATVFVVDVSDAVDPATVDASDFTLNGIPANFVTLINNNTEIEFFFNTSPEVRGSNAMRIPAGAFDYVDNGPVLEFNCSFLWIGIDSKPRPTPAPRP